MPIINNFPSGVGEGGDYVDLVSNQVIDGQKDFEVAPRVKTSSETHNLPQEYQEVEYLESTGTQYLDTGFTPIDDYYEFELDLSLTSDSGTALPYIGYRRVAQASVTGNMRYCFIYGYGDGSNPSANRGKLAIRNGTAGNNSTSTISLGTRYSFHYINKDLKINDVSYVTSSAESSSPSYQSFYLFATNTGTTYSSDLSPFCGKIYYCKLYKKVDGVHTLTNYLIPCYRISDNKPGMYDLITESFLTNLGTGDFAYGDDVSAYKKVLTEAAIPTRVSQLVNDSGYITTLYHDATKANQSSLDAVTAKIPSAATSSNQLADKSFVNSSISTATATFRGTYTTLADLQAASGDLNDYAFYSHTDSAGNAVFDRYKYTSNTPHWEYEYTLNNSSFTSVQWEAINSGVTAGAWVDNSTAQVIDGQKDFEVVPRVKISHETHNLPSAYKEVEYIESTGTQYINVNQFKSTTSIQNYEINLSNNHIVEIDYQLTNNTQTRTGIFGSLKANTSIRYGALLSPSNHYLEFGYNTTYTQISGLPDTSRHKIKFDKNKVYFDGNLINTFTNSNFSIDKDPLLGNFNHDNYTPALAKYFESKWYDENGNLIRHFIPCYRVSDNKPGMIDIADSHNDFYTNAGSGEFSKGYSITYERLLTDALFAPVAFSGDYNDLINKPTAANSRTW